MAQQDARDHRIKTNSILDDYEVNWHQKLGTGISGPVRPCKSKATGERYALKCLHNRPRAWREVNLHLRCSGHPHIVSIIDIYENEVQFPADPKPLPRLFVVMEMMNGGELFDRIAKQKSFTEHQAAHYTREIAQAIKHCHDLNIAHRDLKPENLLLKDNSEESHIKLSDFGFAKEDDGSLTTPHFTPYYVAPQVLEAQKHQSKDKYRILPKPTPYTYDKSCDMWSLGVILYIMLCGYPPFYSETPSKQITKNMKKKIMAGQYDFPRDDWNHISYQAKDLVAKLLKVEPNERLQVDEVLKHPWLKEAPMTQLNSPAIMLDHNAMYDTQQAHAAQLTSLRLPHRTMRLKPMAEANNPILAKRRQHSSGQASREEDMAMSPTKKHATPDIGLEKVRDMIAHCYLTSPDDASHVPGPLAAAGSELSGASGKAAGASSSSCPTLNTLTLTACSYFTSNPAFDALLRQYAWNGTEFENPVNEKELAVKLSMFIQQMDSQMS